MEPECAGRAEASEVLGAEAGSPPLSEQRGWAEVMEAFNRTTAPWPLGPSSLHPQASVCVIPRLLRP